MKEKTMTMSVTFVVTLIVMVLELGTQKNN
jgi:hypothetical protein